MGDSAKSFNTYLQTMQIVRGLPRNLDDFALGAVEGGFEEA